MLESRYNILLFDGALLQLRLKCSEAEARKKQFSETGAS